MFLPRCRCLPSDVFSPCPLCAAVLSPRRCRSHPPRLPFPAHLCVSSSCSSPASSSSRNVAWLHQHLFLFFLSLSLPLSLPFSLSFLSLSLSLSFSFDVAFSLLLVFSLCLAVPLSFVFLERCSASLSTCWLRFPFDSSGLVSSLSLESSFCSRRFLLTCSFTLSSSLAGSFFVFFRSFSLSFRVCLDFPLSLSPFFFYPVAAPVFFRHPFLAFVPALFSILAFVVHPLPFFLLLPRFEFILGLCSSGFFSFTLHSFRLF